MNAGPDLIEVVRQRLVQVASEVLGRLPAKQVPPSLRHVAKFVETKRVRLGAAAVLAALDGDDAFRGEVASVVAASAPELVAAVREGRATSASDPIDVALAAYLDRPDGWPAIVGAAQDRWSSEQTRVRDEQDASQVAELRGRIEELNLELRDVATRAKSGTAAARDQHRIEVEELKRANRALAAELTRREQEMTGLRERLIEAERAGTVASAEADAERRRTKSRIADLEQDLARLRSDGRSAREFDDVRVWLLLQTLLDAGAGLRRELDLDRPRRRPADLLDGGPESAAAGPSRFVADAAAVDRLLMMPQAHLIVDGYNVTKTGYGDLPLDRQRARLVGAMATLAARTGTEVTVVFDGGIRPPAQPPAPRGVRVIFSEPPQIGDDKIRELVALEPRGRVIVVITSDHQVQVDVMAAGGWVAPAAALLDQRN